MSIQIDTKSRKGVPIDTGLHRLIKIESSKLGESIKEFVESACYDRLDKIKKGNYDN